MVGAAERQVHPGSPAAARARLRLGVRVLAHTGLLRENLTLTTEQRIEKMISVLAFAEELRRSRDQGAKS